MIALDGEEFDTGQLFQFDLLQKIIAKLAKNNRELSEKVEDMHIKATNKDRRLEELENKYNVTTVNVDKRLKAIEIGLGKLGPGGKRKGGEDEGEKAREVSGELSKEVEAVNEMKRKKEEEELMIRELRSEKERLQKEREQERERQIEKETETEREKERRREQNEASQKEEAKAKEKETEVKPKPVSLPKQSGTEDKDKSKDKDKDYMSNQHEEDSNQIKAISKKEIDPITPPKRSPKEFLDFKLSDEDTEILDIINTKPQKSNEMLSILFKKVIKSEKRIADLEKLNPILTSHEHKLLTNEDDISQSSNKIAKIQGDIDAFQKRTDDLAKAFEEIRVKVVDFSIYDLFKDNGDGSMDASKALIMTLESKVFKKFALFEERIKEVEENNFKAKNDVLAISNLADSTSRSTAQIKDGLEKLKDTIQAETERINKDIADMDKRLTDLHSHSSNKLSEEIARLMTVFNEKNIQLMQSMKDLIDDSAIKGIQSGEGQAVSEGDLKLIKDLSRKMNELEKSLKLLMSNSNGELLAQQMLNVQNDLQTKIARNDLNELYEKARTLQAFEKETKERTNLLIEKEDKLANDVNFLTKKMETLYGLCSSLQNQTGDSSSATSRQPILDISKFIDQQRFNESNKALEKKIEHIRYEAEDLRRTIDDILKGLKTMPTDDHFRALEQSILATLEESKLHFVKRFADKIDVSKSIKYLETQIKQIIEVYTKKMENGDSWLLAKKPMSNYQCASCESNIRDLSQKYDYLPWNKYPMRDDKAYRMGHGFSRMLQMVNMDILKTAEMNRDHSSDDEKEARPVSGSKARSKLPKVQHAGATKSVQEITLSDDDMYSDGVHKPTDPKVVKIYKKIKHVNIETEPNK